MQVKIFSIPISDKGVLQGNANLRSKKKTNRKNVGNGLQPFQKTRINGNKWNDLKPFPTVRGLSEMVRGFKTFSSRQINEIIQNDNKFQWQKSFYDHIIRDNESIEKIREYFRLNPQNWKNDDDDKIGTLGSLRCNDRIHYRTLHAMSKITNEKGCCSATSLRAIKKDDGKRNGYCLNHGFSSLTTDGHRLHGLQGIGHDKSCPYGMKMYKMTNENNDVVKANLRFQKTNRL